MSHLHALRDDRATNVLPFMLDGRCFNDRLDGGSGWRVHRELMAVQCIPLFGSGLV